MTHDLLHTYGKIAIIVEKIGIPIISVTFCKKKDLKSTLIKFSICNRILLFVIQFSKIDLIYLFYILIHLT